jgi:hypothetical protein
MAASLIRLVRKIFRSLIEYKLRTTQYWYREGKQNVPTDKIEPLRAALGRRGDLFPDQAGAGHHPGHRFKVAQGMRVPAAQAGAAQGHQEAGMIDSAAEKRLRKLTDKELKQRVGQINETLTMESFGRGDGEEARIELMQERSMLLRENKRRWQEWCEKD